MYMRTGAWPAKPIEHEVLPREDVQDALRNIVRIKRYHPLPHPSQNDLLKETADSWPPNHDQCWILHQEQRELRLTGTFSASQLIARLAPTTGQGTAMISSEALHLGPFILPWTLVIILLSMIMMKIMGQVLGQKQRWEQATEASFLGFLMDQFFGLA